MTCSSRSNNSKRYIQIDSIIFCAASHGPATALNHGFLCLMVDALRIQIALRMPIGVRIAEGASGGGQKATKRSQKDSKWSPNGSQMGGKRRAKWSQKEQKEPKGTQRAPFAE